MPNKRVVLAYSGGLDTSVILHWLVQQNWDVICMIGDVGQRCDFSVIQQRALACGAREAVVEHLCEEMLKEVVYPALRAQAVYEGRYLLGTALARPVLARAQVRLARAHHATHLAHGATAKGNDQVRFELAYHALAPELEILAPWKDPQFCSAFQGRSDLLDYAGREGIPLAGGAEKTFSEDDNLLHISHEAGPLEDPDCEAPAQTRSWCKALQDTPEQPFDLRLEFSSGEPKALFTEEHPEGITEPVALFKELNRLGAQHGIGVTDMVENRFVGLKSRGVYEAPGATLLWAAHRDLEGLALDREVMHLRDSLSLKFAELTYNGFWFSPEMEVLRAAINKAQETVSGTVHLRLFRGHVQPVRRSSPYSLYNQSLSSMDEDGGYTSGHALGFIRTHGLRLAARRTTPVPDGEQP